MDTVVLYTNGSQECERAIMLLASIGGEYLQYELGKDFDENSFSAEFGCHAEYPQVAIGTNHVGGLKETLNYLKDKNYL